MEERSSRTSKHNDPKAPSLGPRQQKMGGEGLLYTCPAAYIPVPNIRSCYSLHCWGEDLGPHGPFPPRYGQCHRMRQTSKCVTKMWKSRNTKNLLAACTSKPSKQPVLNWAEGAGGTSEIKPSLLHCSQSVFCWRGGKGVVCLFSSSDIYIQICLRLLEVENQISFLIDFFSRWKCSFNCFLVFDLSISFG